MRKIFVICLLIPTFLFSQKKATSFPFQKKDQFISVQYGFPNTMKSSLESFFGFSQTNKKSIGPVSIAYEYHVNPLLSIGASLSYGSYSADYKDNFGLNAAFRGTLRNTALLLQSTKYFENEGKTLIYAKGSIGINLWSGEYRKPDGTDFQNFNAPTPLGYNAVVGLKYPVNQNTFAYIEAGYGKYIVAAGLALQLNKERK